MKDNRKKGPRLQEAPTEDITKSMPFSNDAEKGVLSCFLHNPTDLLNDAKATIPTDSFYHASNRLLYEVMLELREADRPVEFIALSQHLQDKALMDKIGGPGVLAELLDFVPTPTHYGYYKGILRDKWICRRIIGTCTGSIQRAYEYQDDVHELARGFSEDAVELYQHVVNGSALTIGCDLAAVHDDMVEMSGRKGIQTRLPFIDRYFGGLQETALILFGGNKGAGKSSLVRQIGWRAAAMDGVPTDLITVEMSRVQYYQCICCLEGVRSENVLRQEFTKEEIDIFKRLRDNAKKVPLRIHDDITHIDEAISRIQLGVMKRGVKLVVVDMPQRLSGDNPKSRERELSGIFWKLKQAAKKHSITILAPIHLNAELGALGAQDCENHADQVLIMAPAKHETTLLEPRMKTLFKITKNRYGPNWKRCLFWFDGPHYEFEEDMETDEDIVKKADSKKKR